MSYVILKTRYFLVEQKPVQQREVINQVFESLGFAEYCQQELELYHDRGNYCTIYWAEPGEIREPTYEIIPVAA